MLGFSVGGGLRRQKIEYVMLQISFFMILRSRDVENQFLEIKMIRFEIVNVVGR